MEEFTAIVVAERVAAFIMFAVIMHLASKPEQNRGNLYLGLTAGCSFIGLIADSLTYQQEGFGVFDIPYSLNYILYFLAYTVYNGIMVFFTLYCKEYIAERAPLNKWVFRGPIVIYILVFAYQVVCILRGEVFTYDGQRFVVMSNYLPESIIIITFLAAVYLTIIAFLKMQKIGKRMTALLIVAALLPLSSMVGDFIEGVYVDYSPVTVALGILISYLFLQHSQEQEMLERRKLLEQHEKELEELNADLQKARKDIDNYVERLLAEHQAKEDYYRLSRFDSMTGVYRKGVFLEEAQAYFALNHNQSAGVIFIDIDNFKSVNDTLGHLVGDEAIMKISEIITTSMAHKDIVGRYGGDEFIILMKGITREVLLDKLKFLNKKFHLEYSNETKHKLVTCSMGAVFYTSEQANVSIQTLIRQADRCLYSAKEAGRDTFICANYREEL